MIGGGGNWFDRDPRRDPYRTDERDYERSRCGRFIPGAGPREPVFGRGPARGGLFGSPASDPYEPRDRRPERRDFFDKASDELSSWFGDRDAQRRRELDHLRDGSHHGRGPKGYRRSDTRIREDVSDRLADDPWLDASEIEVSVHGGEVTLSGHVRSRSDKRRAEDLIERVSGVGHVQNNLRIDPAEPNRETERYGRF